MANVTPESVSINFPHPMFPQINTEPTYVDVDNWFLLAVENLASVPSELGGGGHGWVGLAVSDAVYATYSATAWVDPMDPDPNVTYPLGANENIRRIIDNAVAGAQRNHCTLVALSTAIKNLITAAVPREYLIGIRHDITGLANVTV